MFPLATTSGIAGWSFGNQSAGPYAFPICARVNARVLPGKCSSGASAGAAPRPGPGAPPRPAAAPRPASAGGGPPAGGGVVKPYAQGGGPSTATTKPAATSDT